MPAQNNTGSPHTGTARRTFLKKVAAGIMIAGADCALPMAVIAAGPVSRRLPRSFAAAQGVDPVAILKFLDVAEQTNVGLHSIMILRHGRVVAEGWWHPYSSELTHWLYSLSKNVTATAVGLLIDEGRLNLTDKVVSFFPEDLPVTVSERLAVMTIKDLLTMSSGHERDTLFQLLGAKDGNWRKAFFAVPAAFDPGTHFTYNSGCTYMLSAIIQKNGDSYTDSWS
jgi:CubicO group peptidase (beta-lactamase class C family)